MKKTVLITGASRGIGASIARTFYENGYNVAINYNKSEKEAQALLSELSGSLLVKGDVSDEFDAQRIVEETISHFGTLDVLINNAGVSSFNILGDIALSEWERVFKTNITGTFLVSKFASREMINKKSGCIINISSMWGITGASCESCYSASKGAVNAFTKALSKELAPSNIRVNAIAPGFIDTDMNKNITSEDKEEFINQTPLASIGTPEDVSALALFLASSGARFITGQIISCDGGIVI